MPVKWTMCAGVCPFSPDLTIRSRGAEAEAVHLLARMKKKRRAESASPFCSVPEKKRCGSVCSAGSSPPPVLQHHALSDPSPGCRKRASRPDPLESVPEPKKAPAARAPSLQTTAEDSSGKFRDASGATSPAKLQGKRPREEESRPDTEATEAVKVICSNEDDASDDQLCAFNSFQFWRPPLPELDLSLLDQQDTGSAPTKDSTEDMEM